MARDVERGPVSEEGELLAYASPGWQSGDFMLDPWSGLAHKQIVGPGSRGTQNTLAPTWVGDHARRLNAYRLLAAYLSNVARGFLPSGRPKDEVAKFREYGDPAALRDSVRAAVLGEAPTFVVDGAGDEPEEPEPPTDPGPDADEAARAEFVKAKAKFDDDLKQWKEDVVEFTAAHDLQEWVDRWVDDEKIMLKITETENDAVGLGDGVYYVTWSNKKRRVRVQCYDPGFYFPVLNDDDDDYPERVHLAWQFEVRGVQFVRRITFELVDRRDSDTKPYPWETEDDVKSRYVCVMTDASWRYDDIGPRAVDDFDDGKAEYRTNDDGIELRAYPLGIDFIPIVHLPNTIALKHHYGESTLTRVAQIFDDMGQGDTDLAVSADLAGAPPLAVKGRGPTDGKVTTYGPGTVFFGEGMDILDTSHALDALLKRNEALVDRLSVNARVPKEVMGRVDSSQIDAGVIMLLAFGPFRSLISDMRLVRGEKYAMLVKFVQRLAMVGASANGGKSILGGTLKPGPTLQVEMKFGQFLPTDLAALATVLTSLLSAHAISKTTVLRNLDEGGLDVGDDLAEELERVEHEDFEGAAALADATGNESDAAKYLGVEAHPQAAVPAPGTAPVPPGAPRPPAPPAPGQGGDTGPAPTGGPSGGGQ